MSSDIIPHGYPLMSDKGGIVARQGRMIRLLFDRDAFIMAFRIAKGLLILAIVAALVMVLAAAGPVLAGYNSFIVLSGSMEPSIPTGSVVVTKRVRANQLRSGDVITYVPRSERVTTHRIIEVVTDRLGLGLKVKGDANDDPDEELIRPVNVLGRVSYHVPFVGYIFVYANQPGTRLLALGLLVFVVVSQLQQYLLRPRSLPTSPGGETPGSTGVPSADLAPQEGSLSKDAGVTEPAVPMDEHGTPGNSSVTRETPS